MNAKDLAREIVNVTWDVLQTATSSLTFWRMQDLTSGLNLPPLDLGSDWSAAVARVRGELASDALDDAERAAQVLRLVDMWADRIRAALGDHDADPLYVFRPLVTLYLLTAAVEAGDKPAEWSPLRTGIVWGAAAMLLMDVRVQESLLGASPVHRTEHGIWALIEEYATDEAKAAVALVTVELAIEWLIVRRLRKHTHLAAPRVFAGFDVPAYEPPPVGTPPIVDPLAVARESARWTVAIENGWGGLTDISYDAFDGPSSPPPPATVGFRTTIVPVPPSWRFDADDLSRPAMVHIGVAGSYAKAWHLGDDTLEVSVNGDAGILAPAPLMTWDFPWNWNWTPAGSFVEVTGAAEALLRYTTGQRDRAEPDPEGVSLTVDRFGVEARLSVDGTLSSSPSPAGVFSVRADLEGATLTIGRIPWLSAVLPHGASATFDVGVLLNYPIGGAMEFGFRGSAGAELVVPLQHTLGGDNARVGIRQVRIKAKAGRAGDSADAPSHVALEITGDIIAGVRAWNLSLDGVGATISIGGSEQGDGNLLGVVDAGWRWKLPQRIGFTCACPSFHGGGFATYDPEADRWAGGGEFNLQIAKRDLTLSGLVLCEPTPNSDSRSWLALVNVTFLSPAWFVPKGVGVLFAQHRTTDPDALLAAVASGDLAAVLFPEDIGARGAAYLATLGRLLPPAKDRMVGGLFLRFEGLGGKARVDLGVMYEWGPTARAYVMARVLVRLPSLDDPVLRIELGALGVWDQARDEYQLRAALVNSRAMGGDLTGEALLFSGDPDRDDGRAERVRLLSVGGFHPRYTAPGPDLHIPERLSLLIEKGDHLRLECKAYFALTAGALHAGIEATVLARFAGFGIRGNLGFDALISPSLEFIIGVRVGVALYLGSRRLLGASFEGEIGVVSEDDFPTTFLRGRAKISLWLFDYETPRFTVRLGRHGARASASRDPADTLAEAILDHASWDNGGTPGLLLRPAERAGLWASPSAPLRLSQSVVPLDVPITHFNSEPLPSPRALTVEVVRPVAATWTTAPIDNEFAPGMFFALTDEEKLAASAFEALPGGVEVTRPLATGPTVMASLDCEELVIDSANPPERTRSGTLESLVTALAASLDPHQLAAQHYPPRRPPRVRGETFAVVDGDGAVVSPALRYATALGWARQGQRREVVPMQEVA